jgi:O-antigen ligase
MIYFLTEKKWIQAFLCGAMMILVSSTMTVLSGLGAIGYLIWRKSPLAAIWLSTFGFCIGLMVWAVNPAAEFFSFTGRLSVWPLAVKAWLTAPIFGNGPGSWQGKLVLWGATKENLGMVWDHVHNDFLQALVEQGAFGMVLILCGLIAYFWKAERVRPFYGACGVLLCIDALGNFPFHIAAFGLVAGWLATSVHRHN